jgi:hypothetical protein
MGYKATKTMNVKKVRKRQKIRLKPSDAERLNLLEYDKRLKAKRASKAKEAVYMRIWGGVMMAFTVYIWYGKRHVVPMSSLAIIGGVFLAGILRVVYPDGLDSSNKVQKIIFIVVTGVIISLMINRSAFGFVIILFLSLTSAIYLFGVMKSFPDSKAQSSSGEKGG